MAYVVNPQSTKIAMSINTEGTTIKSVTIGGLKTDITATTIAALVAAVTPLLVAAPIETRKTDVGLLSENE